MKSTNGEPVHKKCNRKEKDNYRPVTVLPNLPKDFERCSLQTNSSVFLIKYSLNTNVVWSQVTVLSTPNS